MCGVRSGRSPSEAGGSRRPVSMSHERCSVIESPNPATAQRPAGGVYPPTDQGVTMTRHRNPRARLSKRPTPDSRRRPELPEPEDEFVPDPEVRPDLRHARAHAGRVYRRAQQLGRQGPPRVRWPPIPGPVASASAHRVGASAPGPSGGLRGPRPRDHPKHHPVVDRSPPLTATSRVAAGLLASDPDHPADP